MHLAHIQPAVSALLRVPIAQLTVRGEARSLAIRSALALTDRPRSEIADFFGVTSRTVQRQPDVADRDVRLVERIAGDARFFGLDDRDLTRTPEWRRYWETHVQRRLRRIELDRTARRGTQAV